MKLKEVTIFWVLMFYMIGGNSWQGFSSPKEFNSYKECEQERKFISRNNTHLEDHLTMLCKKMTI